MEEKLELGFELWLLLEEDSLSEHEVWSHSVWGI